MLSPKVLAAVTIVAMLIYLIVPKSNFPASVKERTDCLNNCRTIALGMLNYESENGHFPPAYIADSSGKPMHSWRVLILPYIGHDDLFQRYRMDEPWDGPNNAKLHDHVVAVYRCPSSNSPEQCSDYVVVTGEGTVFEHDQVTSITDILDGTADTLLVTETTKDFAHWMAPNDISLDTFLSDTTENEQFNHPGTKSIVMCDGARHSLRSDNPREELRRLVLIDDGEKPDIRAD